MEHVDKENNRVQRNAGKIIFSLIFALAIFYILLSSVNVDEIIEIIRNIRISFFLLAFSLFYISFLIRTLRWRALLKNSSINVSRKKAAKIMLISWFFNSIFPAKIGDLYRGYAFKDSKSVSKSFGTVFGERVFDIFAIIFLFLISAFFVSGRLSFSGNFISAALFAAGFISFIVIIVFFYGERIADFLPLGTGNLFIDFRKGGRESFKSSSLPLIAAETLLIWLLDAFRLFFVGRALNISMPFSLAFLVLIVGSLLTAFPLSSGGLGAVEAGIAGLLMLAGFGREASVSIALLERLISYWSLIFIGGVAYALR